MRYREHAWRGREILAASLVVSLILALVLGRVTVLERSVAGLDAAMDSLDRARSADLAAPVSPLLLRYQLDLPGRGEVFPAMTAGGAAEYWPVGVLRVTNAADRATALVISAEIPGWSRRTEQSLLIGPREERRQEIQPELLSRAFANEEIRHAVLQVRAAALDGVLLYSESRPVLIHGGSEIYWGRKFANAQMAARWVTPHQRDVLQLVAAAQRYAPKGRLAGYSSATGDSAAVARHVRDQARAVFQGLRNSGIRYVNSIYVMGNFVDQAQRVRLPSETLHLRAANCMDLAVVFASAMENLGMQPILVILPGHALAGVRLGSDAEDVLYLDLTVLPTGSFDTAVDRARAYLRATPSERTLVVDVRAARVLGIYPLVEDVVAQPSPVASADPP